MGEMSFGRQRHDVVCMGRAVDKTVPCPPLPSPCLSLHLHSDAVFHISHHLNA